MATYLADRVVVNESRMDIKATATSPQGVLCGMNQTFDLGEMFELCITVSTTVMFILT